MGGMNKRKSNGRDDGDEHQKRQRSEVDYNQQYQQPLMDEKATPVVSAELLNLRSYLQSCVEGATHDDSTVEIDDGVLVENLAEDMKSSLFDICCDRECSRHLESLLSQSKFCLLALKLLQSLLELKRDKILEILCHPCGSRVMEKLTSTTAAHLIFDPKVKSTTDINWKGCANGVLVQFNEEVVVVTVENLIADNYASHVVRTLAKLLAGQLPSEKSETSTFPVGQEFRQSFATLIGKVLSWTYISSQDYLWVDSVSLVLQDFIRLDSKSPTGAFKQFLKDSLTDSTLMTKMWQDKHMSRVWEVVVSSCTEAERKEIYKKSLKEENLALMVENPFANFVLQRFLDAIETVEVASKILTKLMTKMVSLLQSHRIGVVVAMFGVCRRLKTLQSEMVKSFKEALLPESTTEKESFEKIFRCFLALKSLKPEVKSENPLVISGPGSMIVQHVLNFDKPGLLLKGVEAIADANCLMQLATHVTGSHIIDAVYQSPAVMKKGKVMLFSKFQGHWVKLSCDKFGSRVLETIWAWCDQTRRETIATELCKSQNALLGNMFGRIIWHKYGLDTFKRAPKQWHGFLQRKESKQKLLKNFLS